MQLEKEIAADAKAKQTADANHVRFLLFLKTNYNHQREHGMLKEGPYRSDLEHGLNPKLAQGGALQVRSLEP